MYASRAADGVDGEALHAILRASRAHNPAHGITGVLCLCQDARVFMQVLEGGRAAVNRLYNRIAADPRHHDVQLLTYQEIGERGFAGWAMGQVNMALLNPALVLKYSATPVLDPFSVSGAVSMALFDELLATASVVGQG
jgi:hypothetical protein